MLYWRESLKRIQYSSNSSDTICFLRQITLAKTFAAVLIVLYHACLALRGNWGGYEADGLSSLVFSTWLNSFLVPVFVYCSGALFKYKWEVGEKDQGFRAHVVKRAKRLLVPYVCISVLWAIPSRIIFFKDSAIDILKNFVLMIQPAQLWFLPALFFTYVIFYMLYPIVQKVSKSVALPFMMLMYMISALVWKVVPLGVFQVGNILKFILFFYMGILDFTDRTQNTGNSGVREKISLQTNIFIWVAVEVLMLWIYYENKCNIVEDMVYMLLQVTGVQFFMNCCAKVAYITHEKSIFYNFLKRNSMGIYLIHQQIIYCLIRVLLPIRHMPIAFVSIIFLSTIILSVMLSELIRKSKWGRAVFGE